MPAQLTPEDIYSVLSQIFPKQNDFKNKFWYSYLGLLRIALTLEFGAAYEQYANERDGI